MFNLHVFGKVKLNFTGVKWTQYISYLRWGFQSICTVEFRGLNFTCGDFVESCVETGEDALALYSVDGVDAWAGTLIILLITFIFLLFFFISLKLVSQKPHEH